MKKKILLENRIELKKLTEPRTSVADIAKALGVSHSTVYYWMAGRTTPEDAHRVKLERLYGIPCQGWVKL